MAFEPKPNACGLFVNTKSPDKCDYTGAIIVVCPSCGHAADYWVNGWRKTSSKGLRWLSVKLRLKAPRDTSDAPPVTAANGLEEPF